MKTFNKDRIQGLIQRRIGDSFTFRHATRVGLISVTKIHDPSLQHIHSRIDPKRKVSIKPYNALINFNFKKFFWDTPAIALDLWCLQGLPQIIFGILYSINVIRKIANKTSIRLTQNCVNIMIVLWNMKRNGSKLTVEKCFFAYQRFLKLQKKKNITVEKFNEELEKLTEIRAIKISRTGAIILLEEIRMTSRI